MHTTVSDGTDTPEEILDRVREAGIRLFAVTDHDAFKACAIIKKRITKDDPQLLTGVEFSCKDELGKYHILGYGFDPQSEAIQRVVATGHAYRMRKVRARLEFLSKEFNISFPQEEMEALLAMDNPGKPHIANLMVRYGFAKEKNQAIKEIINQLHVRSESVRPEETAEPVAAEPVAAEPQEPAVQTEPDPAPESAPAEQSSEQPAEEKREENARPRPEPVPVTEEMLENSKKILATMLDYLGLEGTVKAEGKPGKINLLIASNDAGRIIGRKGQSLESLQVLVNRIMQKGDAPCPKIYIDIDGYSSNSKRGGERGERGERSERRDGERRPFRGGRRSFQKSGEERGERSERSERPRFDSDKDEQLRQQALDSAKEVRRWGEPVTLPQMNAHDRRIIHITLEKETDLVTESVGDGNFKSVVITLKKDN